MAILRGHCGAVHAVDYDPRGGRLATASGDGTVRIWDAVTDRQRACFEDLNEQVTAIAYSPDGRWLVAADYNHTCRVFDSITKEIRSQVAVPEKHVRALTVNPAGDRIAVVANYASTDAGYIWNTANGEGLVPLRGDTAPLDVIAFSPGGELVATGSWDDSLRIWASVTGECERTLLGHRDTVSAITFHPTRPWLYSASRDATIRCWNVNTGEPMRLRIVDLPGEYERHGVPMGPRSFGDAAAN